MPPNKSRNALPQGSLDMLILRTLLAGPQHGYAIARHLHQASDALIQVEEGSLYPALHRLEHRGLIQAEWGPSEANRKAKYYSLTPAGKKAVKSADIGLAGNATGHRQHHELSPCWRLDPGGDISMSYNEWQRTPGYEGEECDAATTADDVGDEPDVSFPQAGRRQVGRGVRRPTMPGDRPEEQFGPMRRYDQECRMSQLSRHRRWRRLAATGCLAFAAISGWFVLQLHRNVEQGRLRGEIALLRQEQAALKAEAVRGGYARRIAGGFDLMGSFVDDSGRPLENVTVLIIRKTWPGGGYRQEAFTATTNDTGRFAMPEFVPSEKINTVFKWRP